MYFKNMSSKKEHQKENPEHQREPFAGKGPDRQKISDTEVPLPRGFPGSVLSGIMDWALAGWFVVGLSATLHSGTPYEPFMDFWQWWFAYEFFSWLGLFTVTMFSFRVYKQAEPDLEKKVWQEPSYWYGLGIMLLILLGLLGKASYDMFGDFWFFKYFLIVYAVRLVSFSMKPADKAVDKLIEQTLIFFISMISAFFLGILVLGGLLSKIFVAAAPLTPSGYIDSDGHHHLTRCVYLLAFGTCYYLIMGILAYVLARYPRFTLAGLDNMGQTRKKTFRQ